MSAPAVDPNAAPADLDDQIVVHRSGPLNGTVVVPGAKNSVLKLMAATLMADGVYELSNVPDIIDVEIMSDLLAAIGVSTVRLPAAGGDAQVQGNGRLRMTNGGDIQPVAPYELVERIRASINVLGPLIGRYGRVRLSLPGGDDFGSRPIASRPRRCMSMGRDPKSSPPGNDSRTRP